MTAPAAAQLRRSVVPWPTTSSRNDVSMTSIPAMTSGDEQRQRVARAPSRHRPRPRRRPGRPAARRGRDPGRRPCRPRAGRGRATGARPRARPTRRRAPPGRSRGGWTIASSRLASEPATRRRDDREHAQTERAERRAVRGLTALDRQLDLVDRSPSTIRQARRLGLAGRRVGLVVARATRAGTAARGRTWPARYRSATARPACACASGRCPRRPRRRRRSRSSGAAGRSGRSRSGTARRPCCASGRSAARARRRPPARRRRSGRTTRSGTRPAPARRSPRGSTPAGRRRSGPGCSLRSSGIGVRSAGVRAMTHRNSASCRSSGSSSTTAILDLEAGSPDQRAVLLRPVVAEEHRRAEPVVLDVVGRILGAHRSRRARRRPQPAVDRVEEVRQVGSRARGSASRRRRPRRGSPAAGRARSCRPG